MEHDANRFDVTIIRPKADENPQEVRIGYTMLARILAQGLREEGSREEGNVSDLLKLIEKGGDP